MTLKEAKKILKKEGFYVEKATRPCAISELFIEYEDPTICEAMQVVYSAGYFVCMEMSCFDERKARLKKEHEKNTKAPNPAKNRIKGNFPGNKSIEYCGDSMPGPVEEQPKEGNPALAESASQFNDALLDAQGKKINRLGKEITRLNKVIHKKNMKIEEFRKESSRQLRGKMKMFVENVDLKKSLRKTESLLHDTREANSRNLDTCFKNEDLIDELKKKLAEKTKLAKKYAKELSDSSLDLCKLEKQLKDKDAVLSDVAEELRLTRIREKNLAELGLKYVGENEKLKKKLADKIVDEIDAQALKSAESALAYKDERIADLCNGLESASYLLEEVRKGSKEYCEYGIAAEKMIQKLAKIIVNDKPISSTDFEKCRRWANGSRFNPLLPELNLPELSEEEEEKLELTKKYRISCDIAEEGADHSGVIVFCGKDIIAELKRPFLPKSIEAVALYADAYARAENKHLRCIEWKNDGKKLSATYILENGRKSTIALEFTDDEIKFFRTVQKNKN